MDQITFFLEQIKVLCAESSEILKAQFVKRTKDNPYQLIVIVRNGRETLLFPHCTQLEAETIFRKEFPNEAYTVITWDFLQYVKVREFYTISDFKS